MSICANMSCPLRVKFTHLLFRAKNKGGELIELFRRGFSKKKTPPSPLRGPVYAAVKKGIFKIRWEWAKTKFFFPSFSRIGGKKEAEKLSARAPPPQNAICHLSITSFYLPSSILQNRGFSSSFLFSFLQHDPPPQKSHIPPFSSPTPVFPLLVI